MPVRFPGPRLGRGVQAGTITPTFLAAPQRWHVVVAKALAFAIGGFLLGLSSSLLVAGIAYVGLAIKDIDVVMPASEILEIVEDKPLRLRSTEFSAWPSAR
jgi:hypothetical protein